MTQLSIENTDQSNLITLTTGPTRYTGSMIVSAPLPESFGVDIQSQMSQPFSSFIPQGIIQTAIALKNLSASAGIAIGKFYTGVDSPDINFDMNFVAQYDALTEVVIPVAKLYVMAASHRVNLPKPVVDAIAKYFNEGMGLAVGALHTAEHILPGVTVGTGTAPKLTPGEIDKFLYWLKGPNPVRCYFGNIYALGSKDNPIILSGMEPRFTNDTDYNGLPMKCTVSITLTLHQPYFSETVASTYAQGYNIGRAKKKLL